MNHCRILVLMICVFSLFSVGALAQGSCFLPGTQIEMADGTTKNIEDVQVGEFVLSLNENLEYEISEVLLLEKPVRDHHYIFSMANGKELKVTSEHPLYIRSENYIGWGSIEPAHAIQDSGIITTKISVGDFLLDKNRNWIEILHIEHLLGNVQTYNLQRVSHTNTFFADGFLAHNKHDGGGTHNGGSGGGSCTCQGHVSASCGNCVCSGGSVQYGSACGNCGIQQRTCASCAGGWTGWTCINQGVCSPGATQCVSGRYQTCSSSCGWQNTGTDGDNDGVDAECGDAVCDHVPTRVDSNCAETMGRKCVEYTEEGFKRIHKIKQTVSLDSVAGNKPHVFAQIANSRHYACPLNANDTTTCPHPYMCVYSGTCYENGTVIGDVDSDGLDEVCIIDARSIDSAPGFIPGGAGSSSGCTLSPSQTCTGTTLGHLLSTVNEQECIDFCLAVNDTTCCQRGAPGGLATPCRATNGVVQSGSFAAGACS